MTGEHLVEHGAERVEVGPRSDRVTGRLFRREVRGGPERHTDLGDLRSVGECLDDTEIGEVRFVGAIEEHVARLDVAMHQVSSVGSCQRHRHLAPDPCRLFLRQPALITQQIPQRAPLDERHDDEEGPILGRAEVVHRDHVGGRQTGRRPSLDRETGAHLRVLAELRPKQLDGHDPLQPHVARPEHFRRAAFPDAAEQLVAIDEDARGR